MENNSENTNLKTEKYRSKNNEKLYYFLPESIGLKKVQIKWQLIWRRKQVFLKGLNFENKIHFYKRSKSVWV